MPGLIPITPPIRCSANVVDGVAYTVLIDPAGLRVVQKGKRKPVVTLMWKELVSGEAALATALRASVVKH